MLVRDVLRRLRVREFRSASSPAPALRRKAFLEELEPRLLLSATPLEPTALIPGYLAESGASGQTVSADTGPSGDMQGQVFLLDLDGALGVDYHGPVEVSDIDVPAFRAPDALAGQEDRVVAAMLDALSGFFPGMGVSFTLAPPVDGGAFSTIYVGGTGDAFADYGVYLGLAEQVDADNADAADRAFVFSANLDPTGLDATAFGQLLARHVGHEAGHLLGYEHAHTVGADTDPLAAVAWKPYTHVEIAKDVRDDLLAADGPDGSVADITIDGIEYTVHPKVVAAIRDYAPYYFGGTVGPDGFPDLLMGQAVIHPEMTGTWVARILDMAWKAQDDWSYSDVEKSQILAWAYGFATHAASDHWAHTLVNEFADGIFPAVGDIVGSVTTEQRELANFLRHYLVEGYLGDATPGFDNNPDRTTLPDGDVSNDSTPGIEYAAPVRFIYESFIRPIPNDPTVLHSTGVAQSAFLSLFAPSPYVSIHTEGGNTFVREDEGGDFLKDGFELTTGRNLWIQTSGFANDANNGRFRVISVTATRIVVDTTSLVSEAATGDERIVEKVPETGQITVAVDLATNSFVRTSGSFVEDGFSVGHRFAASGFVTNNADFTVVEVSDHAIKVQETLLSGDSHGSGDEQLYVQGERGPLLNKFFQLREWLAGKLEGRVPAKDWGTLVEDIIVQAATGQPLSDLFLEDVYTAYLTQWLDSLDAGLAQWPTVGLAITKGLFDPQSKRDLQNKVGESYGDETSQARINAENGVGAFDAVFDELDDPNNDGFTDDSFINNYLLPMVGVPKQLAQVRTALQTLATRIDEALEPLNALVNPIRSAIAEMEDAVKDFMKDEIRRGFNIDLDIFEFLTDTGSKMDLASIRIGNAIVPIFQPGDRERLDALMGILPTDHTAAPADLGDTNLYTFYPDVTGALADGVSFDKDTFYAYRNSVTLSKMLLLMERPVDGETTSAGQLSRLFSDQLTALNGGVQQTYDASLLNLNGAHGGNILTMTLPGVADGQPWLSSIDGDHMWRTDSLTTTSGLYRVNTADDGASKAIWTVQVTPGRTYRVEASWLSNVTQLVDNLDSSVQPDRPILPATNATYSIFDGNTKIGTVVRNQRLFPTDDQDGPVAYSTLGDFLIQSGTIRIELDNAGADGNVIAGPVRIVPLVGGATDTVTIERDATTGAILAGRYSETGAAWVDLKYHTGGGNHPLWESARLRGVFRALFDDWQDGGLNFPDLGDATSPDPTSPADARPIPSSATSSGLVPEFLHELVFDAGITTNDQDITLEVVDGGSFAPVLQLTNTLTGTVLAQQALTENVRVRVTGGAGVDTLRIDLGYDDSDGVFQPPVSVAVVFDGGLDTGLTADDRVLFGATGNDTVRFGGFFLDSSDRVTLNSAIHTTGALVIEAGGVILGSDLTQLEGGVVQIRSKREAQGGLLFTDILANAEARVVLTNSVITGSAITIAAESSINIDSESIDFFGSPVKVAAVQGESHANVEILGTTTLTSSADIQLAATSTVNVRVITAPDETSASKDRDAAVATAIIGSDAHVIVGDDARLVATGNVDVSAAQKDFVKVSADGTQGDKAQGASGGTVSFTLLYGDTQAWIAGAATITGDAVSVTATSERTVETFAKSTQKGAADDGTPKNTEGEKKLDEYKAKSSAENATTGEGQSTDVSFAGAVAITDVNGATTAKITSTGLVTGTTSIDVRATARHPDPTTADRLTTVADGSGTVKDADTGVGIAVAINVADEAARAFVSGNVRLQSAAIRIESAMSTTERWGAQATSGASGTDTGVAGSLAVNVSILRSEATVESGATVTVIGGGGFLLRAINSATQIGRSLPHAPASGSDYGVGAAVVVNIFDAITRAEIEDAATLTGAGAVVLDAQAATTVEGQAKAGAKGGTAIAPVVVVNVVNDDTLARVGTGSTLQAASVEATATRHGSSNGTAEGDASGNEDAAVGAAVVVNVTNDRTEALLERSLLVSGLAAFRADGAQNTRATTKASAKGGRKDDGQKGTKDDDGVDKQAAAIRSLADTVAGDKGARDTSSSGSTPKAEVATTDTESSRDSETVSVAGAVSVNISTSTTRAATGSGLTLNVGDALVLHSSADFVIEGSADGSSVSKTGDGVGAAVVLNYGDGGNSATIGAGSTITTDALTVEAVMASDTAKHRSSAVTKSGAGGKDIGVAGSVSVNLFDMDTVADVGANTFMTIGGGDVTVRAVSRTDTKTEAKPENEDGANGSGDDVGVGASVAFDRSDAQTRATLSDAVAVAGTVGDLSITATGLHDKTVAAENGAKGATGVGVSVGVALANNQTEATTGLGTGIAIAGSATIDAEHRDSVTNTAKAEAAGSDTGVGASVGVTVITGGAKAILARNVSAGGNVTVESTSTTTTSIDVEGSASGNSKDAKSADDEADNQVNANPNNGGQKDLPKAQDKVDQGNASAGKESSTEGAKVSVGAAVGVNVVVADNTASIGDGVTVTAGGDVVLRAVESTDATTKAVGSAINLDADTAVGAAVSLNVAVAHNRATVGAAASVTGATVLVEATGGGAGAQDDFIAWGLAAAGGSDYGVAGSVAINVADLSNEATTGTGSHLTATAGGIDLRADHTLGAQLLAGGGGFGQDKAGVGAAVALNLVLHHDTVAAIGADATTDALGATRVTANAAFVPLVADVPLLPDEADPGFSAAALSGGISKGDAAVGGSVVVNVLSFVTDAHIGAGAVVNGAAPPAFGQSVIVSATDATRITNIAGGIAGALDGVGVGVGLDVTVLLKDTRAYIGQRARVHAMGDLAVTADSDESIVSVAASLGLAGGSSGVGGSISVQIVDTDTQAWIDGGASVGATAQVAGDVTIRASGDFSADLVAGAIAYGPSAGVGVGNTTLVHTDDVSAWIGTEATVTSGGSVSVDAQSSETLATVAAAGGGASTAGIGASAVVNVLNETTRAFVADGATVQAVVAGDAAGGLSVTAGDDTSLVVVAGAIGAGGTAGIGAGASVNTLNKRTEAAIGSGVAAFTDGDIHVVANSSEDMTGVTAAAGGAGTAAVMFGAGVPVFTIVTRAFIGDDPSDARASAGAGDVHATGSIEIAADDRNEIDLVVGSAAGAGTAAVGGAVGVAVLDKTTEAFVGAGAHVTADGQSLIEVKTGKFEIDYDPAATPGIGNVDVTGGHRVTATDGEVGTPVVPKLDPRQDGSDYRTNPSFTGQRVARADTDAGFSGLAVTATNRDDVETYTFAIAGGQVAVAVPASVNVVDTKTRAWVGSGAAVNTDAAGAASGQSVLVGAGNDFSYLAVEACAGGGYVGVATGVGVSVLKGLTEAFIADAAQVFARNDVTVKAIATEDMLVVGGGVAGGAVGVAGSVSVPSIDNDTSAYLGTGARVDAGGDVLVRAMDTTGIDLVTASLAGGFVGAGAAVGVLMVTKDTLAFVGNGATVDARGQGAGIDGTPSGALQATEKDGTVFARRTGHGLVVQAESSEDILQLTIAGSGGFVGIGGAVGVTIVDSNTNAFIGANALVNQTAGNPGASSQQGVFVDAANKVSAFVIGGGVGGGYVGVGGAVSVGSIRNDVGATIQSGARVKAAQDVDVQALAIKDVEGYTVSAAGGVVGVQGAISVWSIGNPIEKNFTDSQGRTQNALRDSSGRTADGDAGTLTAQGRNSVGTLLTSYDAGNTADDRATTTERLAAGMRGAATKMNQKSPSAAAITSAINSTAATRGTEAVVESGAVIEAGRDVDVVARERDEIAIRIGGIAGGFVGVGVSVGTLAVGQNVRASAGGTLSAGGRIAIEADHVEIVDHTALSTAGGVAGIGASVSVVNDSSTQSAFLASGASVLAASEVLVRATGDQTLSAFTAQLTSGAGTSGAAFSRIAVDNNAAEDTVAAIGTSVAIGQGQGTVGRVSVIATSRVDAGLETRAPTIGGIATNTNFAYADVTPEVRARIGDGSRIDVTGDVVVRAHTDHDAKADVLSLSVGFGAAFGVSLARANIDPSVSATLGGEISAGGNVTVSAGHNVDSDTMKPIEEVAGGTVRAARSQADAPTGGVFAGSASLAESISDADTTASIANGAVVNAAGAVAVRSGALDYADARGSGFTVTLAGVGLLDTKARASGDTAATVGTRADIHAASLTLDAQGVDRANAQGDTTDLGGLGVARFSTVTATVDPTVQASIGTGTHADVGGNIAIRADARTDADATVNGMQFGLLGSFGGLDGTSVVTPVVSAQVFSSAVDPAVLTARAGAITIAATHGRQATVSDGFFDAATQVDTGADTISTTDDPGLVTGDRITYLANGGTAIGGLEDQRSYGVIVTGDRTVKLGAPFQGSNVDSLQDVIRFDAPHGLRDGERLVYGNPSGAAVGGLTVGQSYYVRVIDDRTIKLARTAADATAPTRTFDATTAVDSATDLVTLAGHGFAANQAVTYRGPAKLAFYANAVDVDADTIRLGTGAQGHGLVDGDQVVYRIEDVIVERPTNQPATPIGGLSANATYYVKVVDAQTVQLATSAQNLANGTFVNLSVSQLAALTKHTLQKAQEKSIAGLVDGQTCYVLLNDANSFRLAATPGGAAIDLNATGAGGTHRIGREGIELDGAGITAQQWLAFDLTSASSGQQRLLGAGGISGTLDSAGGDGVSSATSLGPSYAIGIAGGGADATITVSPTVTAAAGAGAVLTSGTDLSVRAESFANAAGLAGTTSGALLAGLGASNTRVTFANTVTSRVADGARLVAGHDVNVTADSRHTADASTTAGAVSGFYSSTGAHTTVEALPATTVDIRPGAAILADHDANLVAAAGASGRAKAEASGGALIGGGTADARYTIGPSGTDPVTPRSITVAVGSDANVRANHTLTLDARVDNVHLVTQSYAAAGGLGVDPDAIAVSIVNTLATTRIDSGAVLTGVENAFIHATHENLLTEALPYAWGGGAVGSADADAWSLHRVLSRVVGEPDAVVASKNVDVFASVATPRPVADAVSRKPAISVVSTDATNHVTPLGWDRYLTWNADTVLLSAPTPELLVNENGAIVIERGLDAVDEGTRIVVNDLSNAGNAGRATFRVNPATWEVSVLGTSIKGGVTGRIDGDQGTVTVRHTWETVEITNLSAKDLVINDIDPVDSTGRGVVDIQADENLLRFDISHDYGPTRIDIRNLGAAGSPDVILNGVIDNPIGTTNLVNVRGDVRATATGFVRTNRLAVSALGDIGADGTLSPERLPVELVASADRPTALTVSAGDDAYLSLRGLDRDPDPAPFVLGLGTIEAGGDADIMLLPVLDQTQTGAAPAGYQVRVVESRPTLSFLTPGGLPAVTRDFTNHYDTDVGGPVFVPSVGVFGTGTTAVDSTTVFDLIRAGGDIHVRAEFGATRMTLVGTTDLTGEGAVDIFTNGDITLVELDGDLRVGRIESTDGDVTLTAPASIVDAHGDTAADVIGRRLTLRANGGWIGTHLNDLEIDSAHSGAASVVAEAARDVYLVETAGSLTVERIVAGDGEVRLTTRDSIASGEDILVGQGAAVVAPTGSITLQSGDDITVDGTIAARDRLFFAVDHRNADAGVGGHLTLGGTVSGGPIEMTGEDDDDVLIASAVSIAVTGWGRRGNDVLRGGRLDDELYGGEGADELDGGDGNDLLVADSGVGDILIGGRGNDRLFGSEDGADIDPDFSDSIRFGDVIRGGEGDDIIYGLGGADDISGGEGNDWIDGGLGGDLIRGDAGVDTIYGNHGNDVIYGHAEDPTGDDGAADLLFGEWGDDTIHGGAGADRIEGGFGNDRLFGEGGDDVIRADFGLNVLSGGEGDDLLYGSDDGADTIDGGAGQDHLWGYAGNDTLDGGEGDDILEGGAGDDLLAGGAGSDVLVGGANHDTLYGHSVSGAGDDGAVDYLYGDFGTGLDEAGSGADRLYGQGGNDLLFGEGGDDLIEGVAGFAAVEASGGSGNVIDFGDALDVASFVAPVPTAAPALRPVDLANVREAATLPDGADQRGRWGDLGGSATGAGLAGDAGLSREPQVATGPLGAYVVWTDTRAGVPQVYVARHDASGWVNLAGSADSRGISETTLPAYAPSVTVDAAGLPIVAWTQETATGREIRVARFDPAANGGTGAWEALGASLSAGGISGAGLAGEAQCVMTTSGPAVFWLDGSTGAQHIYGKVFTAGAWQALGAGGASGAGIAGGASGADLQDIAVATDGTRVAVTWTQADAATGIRQVYLRELVNGTWTERSGSATGAGVSGATDAAYEGSIGFNAQPTVAYHAGALFVAWQTFSDEGAAITVAQYGATGAAVVRGTFATPELRANPVLASGGGELRLAWIRTPLASQPTTLDALRWNGTAFVEEVPGDAQGTGVSVTGGQAQALSLAVDALGRPVVAWQDAAGGSPEIFARGSSIAVNRTFVADGSTGSTLQDILAANDLGAGDVVVVQGTQAGPVTIAAQDAGVTIFGAPGAVVSGDITVEAGAAGVTLQRLRVNGAVHVLGAAQFTLTESDVSGDVRLVATSGSQVVHSRVGGTVRLVDAVTGALVANDRVQGSIGLEISGAGGVTGLVVRDNLFDDTVAGIRIGVAAAGTIRDNTVHGGGTGLDLQAAFTGLVSRNTIEGGTGVRYDAAAALSGNTIRGSATGIRTTVGGADALGFVAGSGVNDIVGGQIGIDMVDARIQYQRVTGAAVGVRGSGTIGGDSLDAANLVEGNTVGVQSFRGTIQYSRIAANGIGIQAESALQVHHNLIYRNTTAGLLVSGKTGVGVYQNTFYAPLGDNIRIEQSSSNVEVIGNILWAQAGYDLYVANNSQQGFFSDWNDLYATGPGKVGYWTKDFVDVLDWQADIARFDLHSIGATVVDPAFAAPRFVDVHTDDFRLRAPVAGLRFTSPTVDAGDALLDVALPPGYANLLVNGGFESGTSGWTVNVGGGVKAGQPLAWEGGNRFFAGSVEGGFAEQSVDLLAAGYGAAQLDSGSLDVVFGGRMRRADDGTRDQGTVIVRFLTAAGTVISEQRVDATNVADRWELVGGRAAIPVGARTAVFRFEAERIGTGANDAWLDAAFLRVVSEAWAPDLGAYGFGTHESTPETSRRIALRYPDLYTDWEKAEPLAIRWDTVNNTGFSAVRIDLLQDTADGPKVIRTIAAATPDDGEYIWIPETSGIDFGTYGLRIQVSLVNAPEVFDRSQETFTVPEDGTQYWVDDASNAGDEFTPGAVGSNRNTGKLASAPKPNPVNVLRAYTLDAGNLLRIDTGDYPLIDAITLSGSIDLGLGLDEGFRMTGPTDVSRIARLLPAIPGTRFAGLVELNDADFVTVEHLTLANSGRGLYVHDGSDSFAASYITVTGHAFDGISIDTNAQFSDFSHLSASGNGGWGIWIDGPIRSLTDSAAFGNDSGIRVQGAVERVDGNQTYGNTNTGLSVAAQGNALVRSNLSWNNKVGVGLGVSGGTLTFGADDLAAGLGNRVFDNRGNGIEAGGGVLVVGNAVSGNAGTGIVTSGTTRANVVWSNASGIHANGGLVERNRVHANAVYGIDGYGSTLIGNVVYSNATGILLGAPSAGTARNNVVYGNALRGILVTGAGSVVQSNTIYQPAGEGLVISGATGVGVSDNIVVTGAGTAITVSSDSFAGFQSDFNLFQSAGGAVGVWQGVARLSLAAWRSASGADGNSLEADPLFVAPDGVDGILGFGGAAADGRDDDFHLRSAFGTFAGGSLVPVRDAVTQLPVFLTTSAPVTFAEQSPGIDRGRATDSFALEPAPNGGFVNLGAYGNTTQASLSADRYVTLLAPVAGERVVQNRDVEIRWRANGFAGTVDIGYSGPGTSGAFVTLAAGEANDGSFLWHVDATTFPLGQYTLKVSSTADPTVSDVSDAPVEVIAPIAFYYVNDGSSTGDVYTTAPGAVTNDGLSPDRPLSTITDVLSRYDLGPGDVILVDAGVYAVTSNIVIAVEDSGVTIRGAGMSETILDRGNVTGSARVFEFAGADDVRIESLEMRGSYLAIGALN
ncbi:MAG: LEPR-XLL domain-containing protein, partial [Betaproteobacteria bacterium]|nr:LEPR-XLL domain-containing protein [Betaproteobacteria bacterium]